MIFFTDRDLGTNILPSILRAAGIEIVRHVDHFAPDTPDAVWIREVASRGWYALSHDRRIRYVRAERDAVLGSGLGMFLLIGRAPHAELARNVVNTLVRLHEFIRNNPRPFIAKIYRPYPSSGVAAGKPGTVERWL